ncbi:ADP-ribosylation factor family [Babesia microti strain RI]|uniref:ADP-ribosylation factor family n=1 Tax=Babesia microti (strain RI) TaxID=1133968 RepID=I7J6H3_BABMR|nr:ADP-ribosylation factor family [Babesia microti strain RI]CCF73787.1 ADP-ribosylation factor family [Babesia microti strain RI]|eukprot:XP_012648396.1 ADP-ribosylation factor family [Babesia microti strain RI]
MGLLKIIKKAKEKHSEIRIVIVGLDNAGKSSLVTRLLDKPLDQVAPTLGFKIYTYPYKNYNLNIWDIGGQKSIRSFWKNYFHDTDGLIWVVDSADRQRINDCKVEFQKLLCNEHLTETPVLVLANKQDIPGAMTADDISKAIGIDKLSHRYKILPTSALDTAIDSTRVYNLADCISFLLETNKNKT